MTQLAQLLAAPNVDAAAQTLAGWSKAQFAAFLQEIATPLASAPVAEIELLLSDAVGYAMDYARGDNAATNKHAAAWNDAMGRIRALANSAPALATTAHPAPRGRVVVTEAMVVAVARVICREHAEICGVNEADAWNVYATDFKDQAQTYLTAALALVDADAPEVDRG